MKVDLLLILAWNLIQCYGKELPTFIHVCHEKDPNINTCMMAAIEDLRPYLVKGVPEYNIPCLEPLILEDLITEDIAELHVAVSNVTTFGASQFSIKHINVDWDERSMNLHIDFPKLRIYAHYKVDGKILMMPIKSKGDMEANVTDCTAQGYVQMEKYLVDDERHLRFTKVDIKVKVGGAEISFQNMFNGDEALLGIMNDIVNKNLQMFLKEFMPFLEKRLANQLMEIGNSIIEPFTCDQLFPE